MGDDFSGPGRQWQDGIEGRVAGLETRVDEQAGLRAGMDKELGTISATVRAHTSSLSALREVQADHTGRLTRIEGRLETVEARLGGVEEGITTVKAGVHAIVDLLDANLARKGLADRLASRITRHREAA